MMYYILYIVHGALYTVYDTVYVGPVHLPMSFTLQTQFILRRARIVIICDTLKKQKQGHRMAREWLLSRTASEEIWTEVPRPREFLACL